MARIRTVKPDFFRHELLQDLEITYAGKCPMLVFEALWGHCDKAGRFEWKPRMLKLDILPFLPFDMAETLGILEKAGMIQKYTVNGCEYGLIPTFTEHQRIGGKEAQDPEKHPAPNSEAKVKKRGSSREALGKHQGLQEGKGREGNIDVVVPQNENTYSVAFLRFWTVWPSSSRKGSKGPCWEKWRKSDFDLVSDEIIAHVEALKRSTDWTKDGGAFIPAPLVYLNNRRWEGAEPGAAPEKRMVV